MWIAKFTAAVLVAVGAFYLYKMIRLRRHPEEEIASVEKNLLKHLKKERPAKVLLADWHGLCNNVKKAIVAENLALAQRGTETIKLFVGEYFRGKSENAKLNMGIYRELAGIYAATITPYPELAGEMVVALRVAAREVMDKNEEAFDDILRQFTLYGLLALRERKYYFTSKILDQIFLLVPKCFSKGLAKRQHSMLRAIGSLGQAVIKRQDSGLVREITTRLRQSQDTAGRLIHLPVQDMLLKSVRTGSPEILDLLLETSRTILAQEEPTEVKNTLHIWGEAAKTAVLQQDEASLGKIIDYMVRATEDKLQDEAVSTICLHELFDIISFAIRGRTVAEYGHVFFPVLELGCLCMQRELKYGLTDGAIKSYQTVLRRLLDKLLHLGAVVTRDGQTSTGHWVAQLYCQWAQIPDNAYRKDALLKFVQLWLLYWANCQRRTAKRQGGLPSELFQRKGWSEAELARFPNLHIRNT